ncbi:hypothetical protein G6F70_009482 [Rhizopus microsporus]|nr:hypothetical protein G6F71_009530 [Rhizopus microsporus]KAG1188954.1 hypothetical protein G6F70_009482 [Rhizopus microsporus]KAG1205284.1 hypothetical protein G6F69_009458 [Rhizopus microsporus]KAG1224317.1 hypothetical protein G6F67_009528 [Rhizopus microsporus]KAG1266063.1 hypothetical protein G6F68_003072 [Rhizopus microsporus]
MLNNVEENAESVTPMEQPPPISSPSKKNIGETPANFDNEAMKFVDDYMKKKIGKMNWNTCWREGIQQGKLTSYGSGKSLRVQYQKYKKSNKAQ